MIESNEEEEARMADYRAHFTADDGPGPNLRRRELGRELRKYRTDAGMSIAQVAKFAGLTEVTVRRIETGNQTILPRNVRILSQAYEIGAPLVDHLMRQAEESNERGWWAMYSDTMPDWFEKFVGLESDAEELWNYSPLIIDGLLQTSDYAHALFEVSAKSTDERNLQRSIELRQGRQERVNRQKHPTQLHVALDEAAVRRMIGGAEVMRDQLRYLVRSAEMPNITIQVMPFSAGAHLGLQTPFSMLRFPEAYDDMDAVYVENLRGGVWQERPADIKHYTEVFEQITSAAYTPQKTVEFVDSLAASL